MARHSSNRLWAAQRVANIEARRRAKEVGKVALIVIVTALVTLVFTGHKFSSQCGRTLICIERSVVGR
jgi:hypothetical protein